MRPVFALGLLVVAGHAAAAPVDFNRDVRPILSGSCFACHGPDEKARKGDLRLDRRDDAVTAKAVVPGKPAESELIRRLTTADPEERMPPGRSKKPFLTPAQVDTLQRWVAEGAKYSDHWAFTTLVRPAAPPVKNAKWVRDPVDAFIIARLEAEGVSPAQEADRVTLVRRLSFDLTGLPPTPDEVRAFVADKSPDAYEKVVDRLLASPHYGERMAVWWLDLVRFADTVGYHSDVPMNVAPYRDYVIASFNRNKPFDRFTVEQLAGDLLPNPTTEQRVATAYNRLLQTTEEGGAQAKEYEVKYAADRVRNYGQVWLGGTLMCAECHDHKFDPYTQKDFYTVAAFFADVKESSVGRREPGMAVTTPTQEAELRAVDGTLDQAAEAFHAAATAFLNTDDGKRLEVKTKAALGAAVATTGKKTTVQTLAGFMKTPPDALKPTWDTLVAAQNQKDEFEATIQRVLVTESAPPRTVRVLHRGNWLDTSGPVVGPAVPAFLPQPAATTGRPTRLDLARWTVAADNPLAARVAVNRVWKLFFGRGISRSLEESGVQGEPPTHPELLDALAADFRNGWDVKKLVRRLVLSAVYRQSSAEPPAMRERDPLNTLFARQARYRLDAEFVRDNALAVGGLLVRTVGGPSVKPYQPPGYWAALNFPVREWQTDAGEKTYRRGMYTHWQRTFPHPAMAAFDAPSREECQCDRPRSNIPQQALVLLNDPEFVEAARVFGAAAATHGGDDAGRVRWLWERATGRVPAAAEVDVLLKLLVKHRAEYAADAKAAEALQGVGPAARATATPPGESAAWTSVARVVLNMHETVTRP